MHLFVPIAVFSLMRKEKQKLAEKDEQRCLAELLVLYPKTHSVSSLLLFLLAPLYSKWQKVKKNSFYEISSAWISK